MSGQLHARAYLSLKKRTSINALGKWLGGFCGQSGCGGELATLKIEI
jgi:hypothetical protein